MKSSFHSDGRIILRFFAENLGFAKAHNRIFEELLTENYEYVVTLNNDTAQEKDWLEKLILSAYKNQADMVSSKMINFFDREKMDNAGHFMLNTAEIIPYASGEPIEKWNTVFENFGPCAGAALYKTEMLRKIGIFDPFFDTGYEDAELGARACLLGYKSIYEPKAVVYHKISSSVNKIMDYSYKLKIQKNIFYTWRKLMPFWVRLINAPSSIFKYGMVFVIDILLNRKIFFRVMKDAIIWRFGAGKEISGMARTAFQQNNKPIGTLAILKKLRFFLWFDIGRFWKFVILKERSFFER